MRLASTGVSCASVDSSGAAAATMHCARCIRRSAAARAPALAATSMSALSVRSALSSTALVSLT
jgi:hypothetical protein